MRETPPPGGARAGGYGPQAGAGVPPGGVRTGGDARTGRVRISARATLNVVGHAVEENIALPIEPAKSLLARPDASPAERRRWLQEEAYTFAWASAGGFVGDMLQGRLAGVVCFLLAGYYAALRVTRR